MHRNDVALEEITRQEYSGVVLSPGPENPAKAGCLMEVIAHYAEKLPILGICLGHQALGQYFGANLDKAILPMHGKISRLDRFSGQIFTSIESEFNVVRYHSLVLKDIPVCLNQMAHSAEGELMAFEHVQLPITGLQFHPEAALTEHGLTMLSNWIRLNHIV